MSKILFIRGGAVGDFILTLPAIQLIRANLPDVEIDILGYQPIIELARAASLADRTRSIEYGPLSAFFIPGTLLLPELMDYFKSYSVVISHLYDPDGFFAANLERADVKTLIRAPHKVDETLAEPAAVQLARPLEQLALFLEDPFVDLRFDDPSQAAATIFLERAEIPAITTLVALHPGSGSPRKNWSFEGWAETAATLVRDSALPIHFLISSGEAEDRVIGEFLEQLRAREIPFTHAAHLPLPVLGEIFRRCGLYLGHDSGISHLAAACEIPCLLLFGPTNEKIWAPKNPGVVTLKAPQDDLSRFEPATVSQAALTLLGGTE